MPEENDQVQELPPPIDIHVHIWDIIDVQYPEPHIRNPRIGATNVTFVLIKCQTCHLPETTELQGRWTLQQVLGMRKDGP